MTIGYNSSDMNIEHLKKSMKLLLKEKLSLLKYGDNHRVPYPYIATESSRSPFKGVFPSTLPSQDQNIHTLFPNLAKELLLELFSEVGVVYLPEICFHELDEREPLEIFHDFAMGFGVKMEDKLEERYIMDVTLLNQVIEYLRVMDKLRQEKLFDSRPIYKLLAQHNFEKVEKLLKEKM